MAQAQTTFSGPLPPPAVLEQYDEVVPGAAERILQMAEKQAAHRQELERRVVLADINKSYWGLIAAFVLAAMMIAGGSLVAYSGQPAAGAVIAGTAACALAFVFLQGTRARREEREEKAKAPARR